MVDFHSHILPKMDDGSADTEMSIAMLRLEQEHGVTEVVFTPHFYAQEDSVSHFLKKREASMKRLYESMEQTDVKGLTIHVGAEVYYFKGIGDAFMIPDLCIGDSNTVLLEMPFCQWDKSMYDDVVALIQKQKLDVVLAHIERYDKLQKDRSIWNSIMDLPIYYQMNAGPFQDWRKKRHCMELLKQHDVVLLGSDAHNLTSRCPNLKKTCDMLNAKMGAGYTQKVVACAHKLLAAKQNNT